jgi:hypothetical protein
LLRQAVSHSAANLSLLLLLTSTDIDPVFFRVDFAELTYFKHLTFGNKKEVVQMKTRQERFAPVNFIVRSLPSITLLHLLVPNNGCIENNDSL